MDAADEDGTDGAEVEKTDYVETEVRIDLQAGIDGGTDTAEERRKVDE